MSEETTTDYRPKNDQSALEQSNVLKTNEDQESQQELPTSKLTDEAPSNKTEVTYTDNGIFDFMTPERAIELYRRIHSFGLPELDWKFHGRRRPDERECTETADTSMDKGELQSNDNQKNQTVNTEFDFDEELSDLHMETSIANESLSLKRRPEPSSDKKTNLNDIMSDIMKETHIEQNN